MMAFYMLMTLIRSRLQGRELKTLICVQVQDNLPICKSAFERVQYVHFLYVRSFYESQVRIFER